jgi:hypothetical protein
MGVTVSGASLGDHTHSGAGQGGSTLNPAVITMQPAGYIEMFDGVFTSRVSWPTLTADHFNLQLPDADGELIVALAGVSKINSLNNTADIATIDLVPAGSPAGMYVISTYMECSVGTGAGTEQLQFVYNDRVGTRNNFPGAGLLMTAGNAVRGFTSFFGCFGGSSIQWRTTGYVSGTYHVTIRTIFQG